MTTETVTFWLRVGNRVEHVGDVGLPGTVTHLDWNLIELGVLCRTPRKGIFQIETPKS